MTLDFAMRQLRPFGAVLRRFGAQRASPENALRALRGGAQVLVYPGGDLDAYRHARRRDEVVLGERTGFVRAAREAGVPIEAIVAQGAHRSAYILAEGQRIVRLLDHARAPGAGRALPRRPGGPWGLALGPWLPW